MARDGSDFRVTLLGTGTPQPRINRFGPSTLVQVAGQTLLFDAGRGATMRLWQLRVPLSQVEPLFLTHYHSDHTNGIPDLWLTGWLPPVWGRRVAPFKVIGPTGARVLMEKLQEAYALDIKIRLADEKMPVEGILVDVTEFDRDGVVYEKAGVTVTAFEVDHGAVIKPAYGYRVDYDGRSVVLSSDTRPHPNVVKYGKGSDLLVHEVAGVSAKVLEDPFMKRIMDHHTCPRDAGAIFAQAKPKMAAYTHLVILGGGTSGPALTLEDIITETRETYDGPLVIGEDLTSFDIGDTVTMRRFEPGDAPREADD